jgi:hypothetical protein
LVLVATALVCVSTENSNRSGDSSTYCGPSELGRVVRRVSEARARNCLCMRVKAACVVRLKVRGTLSRCVVTSSFPDVVCRMVAPALVVAHDFLRGCLDGGRRSRGTTGTAMRLWLIAVSGVFRAASAPRAVRKCVFESPFCLAVRVVDGMRVPHVGGVGGRRLVARRRRNVCKAVLQVDGRAWSRSWVVDCVCLWVDGAD